MDLIRKPKYIIWPIIIIMTPAILILDQPDLGTAIILILTGVSILFMAGIRTWKFIAGGIMTIITIPFFFGFLHYMIIKKIEY